ncbi:MAG: ATP-binding protein [Actinomycetaceae bacterium]|nr:ATP-binding protein [Actinomycetaceae bacterium]
MSDKDMHTPVPEDEHVSPVHPELQSALTTMASVAIVVDEANNVLRADARAYSLGLVRDDVIVHETVKEMVDSVRRTGLTERRKMELPRSRHSSDSPIYLDVRVATLLSGRVLILADDETKEKRVDAVRRDFTANVSHELKTPIGAIQLMSETIADNAEDPEAVKMFAPRLITESKRLGALVQDLIDLSRLEKGDPLLNAKLVNIDEAVWEAVELQRNTAVSARVALIVGEPCGGVVWGDYNLLVTAIRNLVDNAIRYSEPDTRVTINASVSDDLVRVAIVDSGLGIPDSEKARVFERFYRVDPARSRNTGGTGLGLSIVKHIAADHGGTISVWSKPGRGSTFTLVIPQAEEEDSIFNNEDPDSDFDDWDLDDDFESSNYKERKEPAE